MMPIEARDVAKGFGSQQVLRALSLQVPEGAVYGLLG
jgi:ABC-type multidrug transport system ATPase subunit